MPSLKHMAHKPLFLLFGVSCVVQAYPEQEGIQDRTARSKVKGLSEELNEEVWWTWLPPEYLLNGLLSELLMDTGCSLYLNLCLIFSMESQHRYSLDFGGSLENYLCSYYPI